MTIRTPVRSVFFFMPHVFTLRGNACPCVLDDPQVLFLVGMRPANRQTHPKQHSQIHPARKYRLHVDMVPSATRRSRGVDTCIQVTKLPPHPKPQPPLVLGHLRCAFFHSCVHLSQSALHNLLHLRVIFRMLNGVAIVVVVVLLYVPPEAATIGGCLCQVHARRGINT